MNKLLTATLALSLSLAVSAQTTTKPAPKAAAASTKSAEPWASIPIPPLHAFKPQEPRRIDLPNGLTIFLQEDHELPFINGSILIRGGSRNEPANKIGLVSLYGSTWRTSGTAKVSGDVLDDQLAAKAASIETSGGAATTSLSWSSLKGDFPSTFASALDLLLHPDFQQAKLDLARRRADTGIAHRNDDPDPIAGREAAAIVYGSSSPYARHAEYATLDAVTLDDLKAWHQRTVIPNGMIVAVEGDFDSAAMEATLRQAFSGLPRGTLIAPIHETFSQPKPGIYFVDKQDIDQSTIFLLGLGTDRHNPDFYALTVMNEIFSGGFGSRLVQNIRTKLGLAYSVGGNYGVQYDHPGVFDVEAATKSSSTVATTKALLAETENLKSVPPTAAELKDAKDQLLNSFVFRYDSPDKVLNEQVSLFFYGYPPDLLAKYKPGIEAVTAADVERVAHKYIDASKLAILVVGNASEIEPKLDTLGAVTPIDITIPGQPGAPPASHPAP